MVLTTKTANASLCIRYAVKQKKRYYLGIFPNMGGGVFPNPKTFVNLPSIFLYAKLGPKWPQMVKNMLYWSSGIILGPLRPLWDIGKLAMFGHFWPQKGVFFVSIYQAPDWFWRTSFWHFEAKTNWEPWQLPRWFWSLQFTIKLCKCASIVSEFVLYKKEFFTIMKMLRWPTS